MAAPTCPRCRAQHPHPGHLDTCAAVAQLERDAATLAAEACALIPARPVTAQQIVDVAAMTATHTGAGNHPTRADYEDALDAVRTVLYAGWRP